MKKAVPILLSVNLLLIIVMCALVVFSGYQQDDEKVLAILALAAFGNGLGWGGWLMSRK